jgi:YD repeat-containing protein
VYENTSLPWALTGVVDERGIRYSTFTYDTAGRALSTEHAGGVDRFSVSYGTPPAITVTQTYDPSTLLTTRTHDWQAPAGVQLTRPNGETTSASTSTVLGYPQATGQSQPAGSGCAAANSASTFDASGNLTSTDDFSGQRSCFAYDSSNRETVRVEGLVTTVACSSVLPGNSILPPGSRKIETSWHADRRLPVNASEPLSITSTVYHGQPDPFNGNLVANCTTAAALPDGKAMPLVCRQMVRATTDTDGALGLAAAIDTNVPARSSSFTYDVMGRVLTSTDPLNRLTTYAYYGASAGFSGSNTNSDASFSSVSLLLHGDGADGSTAFFDSGSFPKAPVVGGGAQISTAQSMHGGASMKFNGSSSLLTYPHDATLDLASGDFTIEASVYISSLMYHNVILQKDQSFGTTFTSYAFYVATSGQLQGGIGTGNGAGYSQWLTSAPGLITSGQFYHVAFTRQGSVLRLFVNGALVQTATQTGTPVDGGKPLVIGRYPSGGGTADGWFNGYIDELRITKGMARYIASFTRPTQAFPNAGFAVIDPNETGHSAGDLQSITDAAGHATQFTLYDRAGRVKRMVDPNGVVTDTAYTPRGWVSSVMVTPPGGTARTTSYTYDNAGQMTGATLPDGTTLGYSYDAAHRLTGVTDAKGNSVTYTLDNTGNKTGEQVKDPSGNLQRNITRVYDALNRVQQVTGASN